MCMCVRVCVCGVCVRVCMCVSRVGSLISRFLSQILTYGFGGRNPWDDFI